MENGIDRDLAVFGRYFKEVDARRVAACALQVTHLTRRYDWPSELDHTGPRNEWIDGLSPAEAKQLLKDLCKVCDNFVVRTWVSLRFAAVSVADSRSDVARKGGRARVLKDKNGKAKAMGAVFSEWLRWQRREVSYKGEADFGRKMHLAHPELVSDRSIAQAASRWRKQSRNTSS